MSGIISVPHMIQVVNNPKLMCLSIIKMKGRMQSYLLLFSCYFNRIPRQNFLRVRGFTQVYFLKWYNASWQRIHGNKSLRQLITLLLQSENRDWKCLCSACLITFRILIPPTVKESHISRSYYSLNNPSQVNLKSYLLYVCVSCHIGNKY